MYIAFSISLYPSQSISLNLSLYLNHLFFYFFLSSFSLDWFCLLLYSSVDYFLFCTITPYLFSLYILFVPCEWLAKPTRHAHVKSNQIKSKLFIFWCLRCQFIGSDFLKIAYSWNNGTSVCRLISVMPHLQRKKQVLTVKWRQVGMSADFVHVLITLYMCAHLWNNGTSVCRLISVMSPLQYEKQVPLVKWRQVGMSVYFVEVFMALDMCAHSWNNGTSVCRLISLMSQLQHEKQMLPVKWRHVGVSVDFVHDFSKVCMIAYSWNNGTSVCRLILVMSHLQNNTQLLPVK